MKKSLVLCALSLSALFWLSACAPLLYHSYEGGYVGLAARLQDSANSNAVLHIVVVHGIGNHTVGYSTPLANALAAEMNLAFQNDSVISNLTTVPGVTNFLREYSYRDGPRLMKFHEVTWTPSTTNIKAAAFSNDIALGHRVLVNKALKVSLMDQSLSDAVLYMNPVFRPRMQQPILDTIESVAHQAGPNDHIVLIASSLGSKMIFDTAVKFDVSNTNVQRFEERMTDMIMLANQLPLLHLGTGTNVGDIETSETRRDHAGNKFFGGVTRQKRSHYRKHGNPDNEREKIIHVIAATDPNDLLSYPLDPADVVPDEDSSEVKVIASNIYSHNAWAIPFLFENPEAAHDNYDENSWLVKKLVHGFGPPSAP
jgi:hypothetical protein